MTAIKTSFTAFPKQPMLEACFKSGGGPPLTRIGWPHLGQEAAASETFAPHSGHFISAMT